MTDFTRTTRIAVYGSSAASPGTRAYDDALDLGRRLARAGAELRCGGYGGVMEAVSKGAASAGGRCLGFTIDAWKERPPNSFLTEVHSCTDLYQRLRHLIDESDAMIAVGGGIGTLVEVLLAWNLLFMELIPPRPLIVVGRDWSQALDRLAEFFEIREQHREFIQRSPNVDGAVDMLRKQGVLR